VVHVSSRGMDSNYGVGLYVRTRLG
jgi:hypothetical protein